VTPILAKHISSYTSFPYHHTSTLVMTSQIVFLVSLNKTPARAVTLIEDVLARLKLPVNIVHVANSACMNTTLLLKQY
jgi:hypothetical protein